MGCHGVLSRGTINGRCHGAVSRVIAKVSGDDISLMDIFYVVPNVLLFSLCFFLCLIFMFCNISLFDVLLRDGKGWIQRRVG